MQGASGNKPGNQTTCLFAQWPWSIPSFWDPASEGKSPNFRFLFSFVFYRIVGVNWDYFLEENVVEVKMVCIKATEEKEHHSGHSA